MSDKEYKQVLEFMEQSLVKGQGMVGIFWYSPARKELFGVHKEKPAEKCNCSDGRVSCSLLHKDLWKKEFNKQKFSGKPGLFIGDYKDKPRGKVFYQPSTGKFTVCIGSWIRENVDAIDLIVDEFGLEREDYEFTEAVHWEIGMRYGE